jgi:carboxymethylenebutenolidase
MQQMTRQIGGNMTVTQPDGYLALPESGQGPGILVLHAWWGLNPFFKDLCQRLAREGFVVFAPDLYHDQLAVTIEEAERLSDQLEEKQAYADIAKAIEYLQSLPDVTSPNLAVIGFSLGAFFALSVSSEKHQDIRRMVLFYGTGPGDFILSQAEYLGHFAETDEFEPASNVKELETSLRAANRPVAFYTYPGTGHWFFEADRAETYNAEAAKLAWKRTLEFLRTL